MRPASAQLAKVETRDVCLVYVPDEAFVVPHAARTFLNSLAFQKRLFDFTPTERITVLLTDFEDGGGASATAVPRNSLAVSLAPVRAPFETVTSNDRMNLIMNHELVHIVTLDRTARSDRMFRRLFAGKVLPIPAQPESVLYFFLTTPRVAAPRWFHEGIATFLDTWMAGGIGRAQSGYYEMVFRSMVKDGVGFYDRLGLVSEGTEVDFMLQTNSYLYGTRFMVWAARTFGPGEGGGVGRAARRRARLLLERVQARVRAVAGRRLGALDRGRARVPTGESGRGPQYSLTAATDLTHQALGSVSRAFYDPERQKIYAAFNYPGVVAHLGAISAATGNVERPRHDQGPRQVHGDLARPRSRVGHVVLHDRQCGLARHRVVGSDHEAHDTPDPGCANRRPRVRSRSRGVLWGIREVGGLCSIVRIPVRSGPTRRCTPSPTAPSSMTWTYRPTGHDSSRPSAISAASRTCASCRSRDSRITM